MAVSLTEFIRRLKALKADYESERINIFLAMANDANALMKIRVINKRVNDEGQIFGIYAESTLKSKGTRNARGGDSRINFSDTNRMWSGTGVSGRGIQARLLVADNNKISIVVEPENDQNRIEVLGILEDKYGPIVAWSEQEQALLLTIFNKKLDELVRRNGL